MFAAMRIASLLIASLVIAAACSDSTRPTAAKPSQLMSFKTVSGNAQTGAFGAVLSNPIVVAATDSNGKPGVGVFVVYGPSANGNVLRAPQATDSSGQASASWQLDPNASKDTLLIVAIDPHNDADIIVDTVYATAVP